MRLYRGVCAALIWFAVGLQYWLILQTPGMEAGRLTLNFLSYFTILTNIACALAFTLPLAAPRSRPGRFFARFGVRTAVCGYILMVGVVYMLVLAALWEPKGWQWVADSLLHYATPGLFLIDWLVFTPKARLAWSRAFAWLLYPALYSAWTLAHGAVSGFYPYPFADASKLGYGLALVNLAGMMAVFAAVGLALIGLARRLSAGRLDTTFAGP